jgi:superfamily I DNA/RNA helicase
MGSRLGDLGDMIKQLKEGYTIDNVYMRTNYRSTNEILNVANSIVQVI